MLRNWLEAWVTRNNKKTCLKKINWKIYHGRLVDPKKKKSRYMQTYLNNPWKIGSKIMQTYLACYGISLNSIAQKNVKFNEPRLVQGDATWWLQLGLIVYGHRFVTFPYLCKGHMWYLFIKYIHLLYICLSNEECDT